MPIVDPAGSQKYWLDGTVFEGLQKTVSPPDPGTRKYWLNGTVAAFILGAAAGGGGATPTVGTSVGTSTVTGVAVIVRPTVGTIAGISTVNGVALAVGVQATVGTIVGTSTVNGVAYAVRIVETIGTIAGSSTVTGVAVPLSGTIGTIAGTSTVTGVAVRKKAAIGANAFTYLPLSLTVAQFTPRRRPMVRIQDSLNDAPNRISFTSHVLVLPGQNLDVDFDDGVGSRFTGEIQRVDFTYEENIDQLIWNVTAVDYIFQLNKKRPFGNWEDVSITTIIQEIFAAYAPGFTTTGLQSSLPAISVVLDGSMPFSSCLSFFAKMALAKWRLNEYDLQFFTTDPGPNPDDITSSNTDLLKNQPITYSEDISQVRNRVFGKGAAAQVVSDTPPGSEALQVEGLDLFSDTGGQAYTSGMVLNYTGRSTVYIPVDRGAVAGAPTAHAMWDPMEPSYLAFLYPNNHYYRIRYFSGGIKGTVRYYVSYVRRELGESPLSPVSNYVTSYNYQPETVDFFNVSGAGFIGGHTITRVANAGDGGVPAGSRNYRIGLKYSFGAVTQSNVGGVDEVTVSSPGPGPNSVTFGNLPISGHPDVVGVVFWRQKQSDGLFYEVGTAANGADEYTDRLPDAALGSLYPDADEPNFAFEGLTMGIQVRVGLPISPDPTVIARKLYRDESIGSVNDLDLFPRTKPLELVTINDNSTDEYIDEAPLRSTGREAPKEPAPIVRYYLVGIPTSGVGSITKWIRQGADVNLYVMREDLAAQLLLAQREGGDGIREHDVPDTKGMVTTAEMIRRLDAELILFATPVKKVAYSTRDRKTRVGTTVIFNLLNPPITGTFKIESVTIDEMHETDDHIGLKERRNVVASTAGRFTLDDLLRKAVLIP